MRSIRMAFPGFYLLFVAHRHYVCVGDSKVRLLISAFVAIDVAIDYSTERVGHEKSDVNKGKEKPSSQG